MGIIAIWKTVSGFVKTYKIIMGIVAAAGIAISVFNYIDNHGEMKAQAESDTQMIAQLVLNVEALQAQVNGRDARIKRMNAERLEEIAVDKARLKEAEEQANVVREENAELLIDLGVTRFELLEAIRDDEVFADWVDGTVPVAGWDLLRNAATDTPAPSE